jgi:hypothetical protein
MRRISAPGFLIPSVAALLLAVTGFALWKKETKPVRSPAPSSYADADEPQSQPRVLTAEEEAYEAAMWPIHREVMEGSAGTMTLAGIIYFTEGHDVGKLVATVQSLERRFQDANERARTVEPPSSMAPVHAEYVEAMSLYERASTEMLKMANDRSEEHLLEAQRMAQSAAEHLVKAGDILWPGEHKPN